VGEHEALRVGDLRKFIERMSDQIAIRVMRQVGDRRAQRSEEVVMIVEQAGDVVILDRSTLERMLGQEQPEMEGQRASYDVEDDRGGFGMLNLEQTLEMVRQLREGEGLEISRGPVNRARDLLRRIANSAQKGDSGYRVASELIEETKVLLARLPKE
jgi:hypothetical protein